MTTKGKHAVPTFREVGVINDLPVIEVSYPAWWRDSYQLGSLVPQWRRERPGEFEEADCGMSGSPDLFAQSCLAYALSQQGYRSTMWYKLALEPSKAKAIKSTPERLTSEEGRVGEEG